MKCPVCGKNRNKDIKTLRETIKPILREDHVNPRGRSLTFINGLTLQLQDQCTACDEQRVYRFLGIESIDVFQPLPDLITYEEALRELDRRIQRLQQELLRMRFLMQ